ncbi:FG-GAP-like repeat-containing protein [Streptosporangium sp. NBC_01755]|uniref:FG-GAP-like repeat-containing protein n=1 Tax=unclassified Streptosporangium TaxID=2632669 RepID=UPI002DD9E27C|nr:MULTISPECIES: FG-GAP-like repeat-containing protein [unclassified Streptosporangium]WSA26052.1 FG-GAP-like repeat-containing protein [Streptosporangium sp. NBC_01810]WSD02527.1 FG-GAP-like repeat-containing protein [Streptosporangium sp. NBC_01755]
MRLLLSLVAAVAIAWSSTGSAWSDAASAPAADCTGTGASDFDGDGVDDIAVGDPFAGPGGSAGTGAVHVLFGRGEGGTAVTVAETEAGDGFGWSVRLVRIDGDGCADLIIGAPYADVAGHRDAGAVYVVHGGPDPRTIRLVSPYPEADAHFGWSLAFGGTLVAVGAPHENADGVADSGAVYLFDTETSGEGRRISQETKGVTGNSEAGDMFGWSPVLGKLGGAPGELDLAVGSPYENDDGTGAQAGGGKLDAGALTVIFDVGRAKDEYKSRKWDLRDIVDAGAGDLFGYAVAYGEQGDTGYLAVSAPLGDGGGVKDSGLVQLFLASSSLEITAAATFHRGSEGAPDEGYGTSLAFSSADDVRLAVGVPFDGPDQRGGVRLLTMGEEGAGRLIAQSQAGDHFGWSVGFSGNRLVVGAPDREGAGEVVLLGRNDAQGVPLSPGTGRIPALEGAASADFGSAVG